VYSQRWLVYVAHPAGISASLAAVDNGAAGAACGLVSLGIGKDVADGGVGAD
jgi:hypothetical protein